jgi:lipopolysaccharide/colanic/teichoic acid biosynthesis glycosyltransferase
LSIKIDGGPILYAHKRIGLGGRTFRCLKFRSMVVNSNEKLRRYLEANPDANAEWKLKCKLRRDPRVTHVGRFLRRYSFDELPQLLNVLRGDMSLVGPRPIAIAEASRYDNDIAYYYRVRPGITGVWQVSGRNKVSYAKRVQMDVWYVRNWSLWHDVAILCKTLPVLLKPSGAY